MHKTKLHGRWVRVDDRTPIKIGVKITMTEDKIFGVAIYHDGIWVSALPSYMGEVFYWYENYDDDGNDVDFLLNRIYD